MLLRGKPTGSRRRRVLAIRCATDPVLHAVAPLGLAAARGTALVVDLDDEAPPYPGSTSLARLVAVQPRLSHLRPHRQGVAVLANGSVKPGEAGDVTEALVAGWPAVVFRLGASHELPGPLSGTPVVPVLPLFPGLLRPTATGPAVYQAVLPGPPPKVRGVVLPPLGRSRLQAMLSGMGYPPRHWVRAWTRVWEMSWT